MKKEFTNKLAPELDDLQESLRNFTNNNFKGLKDALPTVFGSRNPEVERLRNKLTSLLGSKDTNNAGAANAINPEPPTSAYADARLVNYANPASRFLGIPADDSNILGTTFDESVQAFRNHTDELSGVIDIDKKFEYITIPGKVPLSGTVNLSTGAATTLSANLSQVGFPTVNIGAVINVAGYERCVTGKTYETLAAGLVTIDVTANANVLYSTSVVSLNLAQTSIKSGTFIKVNSEYRQVNTINALGDYLTVYRPFKLSNTAGDLLRENGIVVNTAIGINATDQIVYLNSDMVANSLCLDTVITGQGTKFTDYLSVDDKILYDNKEYFVVSLTDTTIEVDEELNQLTGQIIKKVSEEFPVVDTRERIGPDEILSAFSSLEALGGEDLTNINDTRFDDKLGSRPKSPIYHDLSTRYRNSQGNYVQVYARSPTDITQSLNKSLEVTEAKRKLQYIADDLQEDIVSGLTDAAIASVLDGHINDITGQINQFNDLVKADIAAFTAITGLLDAIIKIFNFSCAKQKKQGRAAAYTENDLPLNAGVSDEYLRIICRPNPVRQGCNPEPNESDFPDILDQIDQEYNSPEIPSYPPPETIEPEFDSPILEPEPQYTGLYDVERENIPDADADVNVVQPPDVQPRPDPCNQPC